MFRAFQQTARTGFRAMSTRSMTTNLRNVARPTPNISNSLEEIYLMQNAFSYSPMTSTNATAAARTAAVHATNATKTTVAKAATTTASTLATPAQAGMAPGILMIPLGVMISITLFLQRIGFSEWPTTKFFEKEIMEKRVLKKLSSIGADKENIERNRSSKAEYADHWHNIKQRRSVAMAKVHNEVDVHNTTHI